MTDLIKQATDIIHKDFHDLEDLKKLSIIRFDLSCEYKETNTRGATQEGQYNGMRAKITVEKQNEGMAVGKSENEAKSIAEGNFGHYRETNAEAQGIKDVEKAIEGFIIVCQSQNKSLEATKF